MRFGFFSLAAAALLAGLAGCAGQMNAGKIALDPQEFDLGVVPNTAPVDRIVQVRNEGQEWLEITGISTSCGCTTAEAAKRRLSPGESTELKVTFDPQVHGGETGQFLRQVYVRSTDPETPEVTITFRVTVVDANAGTNAEGGEPAKGQALASASGVGQGWYSDFLCPCCGQTIGSCTCSLAAERRDLVDRLVATGHSQGQIYKAMFRTYGSSAFSDPKLAARVRANLAAELPADRPQIVVDPQRRDIGAVPIGGGPVMVTFAVRNKGGRDLRITGLQTSCGCTTALLRTGQGESPVFAADASAVPESWSAVLRPGEGGEIVVTFDPLFHGPQGVGRFTRSVFIFSDDPLDPRVEATFQVEVIP